MEKKIQAIVDAVTGLKYSDWCRIRHAIEQKYASESAKVRIDDSEALAKAIWLELS